MDTFPAAPNRAQGSLASAAAGSTPRHAATAAALPWVWPAWLLLALLWLLPSGRPLAGPDEGRYAEIAREMWRSGDWVTPHLNGFVYFEKPPLQYWLNALSFGLFGPGEGAVRLYNVLAGLGCGGLAALFAARLWGRRAGVMAGFATVAMLWPLVLAAILTLDMGLALWLFAGVGCYALSRADPVAASRPRWMLLAWGALALAMLSKGLVALVLPAGTLLAYALLAGRRGAGPALSNLRWGPGVALFLGLTVPWFWLAARRNPGFLEFFFIHEHFQRFATDTAKRPGAWWYFLPLLFAGALPLATLLGPAWRVGWQRGGTTAARQGLGLNEPVAFETERFLWLWVVFVVVFFSVSRSKLPAYILPVFPVLGLLLGRALDRLSPRRVARHLHGVGLVLVAGAVALEFDLGRIARRQPSLLGIRVSEHLPRVVIDAAGPWLVVGLGAWGVGLWLAAWQAHRGRGEDRREGDRARLPAALALAALATAAMGACLQAGYGRAMRLASARGPATALAEALPPGSPVYSVETYDQGLPFYLGHPVILVAYTDEFAFGQARTAHGWLPDVPAFVARWRRQAHAGALLRPALFAALRAQGVPLCPVFADATRVAAIRCAPDQVAVGPAAAPPLAAPDRRLAPLGPRA